VHLDLDQVKAMDHTTAETLSEWINRRRHIGQRDRVTGPASILQPLPSFA